MRSLKLCSGDIFASYFIYFISLLNKRLSRLKTLEIIQS